MNFTDKLRRTIDQADSLLCVGLDADRHKLPAGVGQFEFNKAIIDATAEAVCAYKPNTAFYEALGAPGVAQLKLTCDYLRERYPEIPIIMDAKRGDIGNTNEGYAEYVFDYLGADAVTVAPYMGAESLGVFLRRADKGVIVLARTSNAGSGEFQDLVVDGEPLYMHVAQQVSGSWNKHGNCMLVVGATYPLEMQRIRAVIGPDMPMLVPGIGAQGGDLAAVMAAGLGAHGRGLIVSASRGILYAGHGPGYAEAAGRAAQSLRDDINKYRNEGTR